MVADQQDLESSGDEEQEGGNDGDGEDGRIESAGSVQTDGIRHIVDTGSSVVKARTLVVGESSTERGVDNASAGARARAGQDGDGDHGASEENIEELHARNVRYLTRRDTRRDA